MAHRPILDNSVNGVRSRQNLSCNWTGSADFGRLVPIHWEELLQGDHVITCKPRIEMQMLPLASPTFGKIDLYCHYFVVPIRQLWDSFYDVWSQTGVNKSKEFPCFSPWLMHELYHRSTTDPQKRAVYKHWTSLGLNPFFAHPAATTFADKSTPISYFPFAAYNKIWWDFYRDPELVADTSISQYLYTGDIAPDVLPSQVSFVLNYLYPHVRSIKNCWISDLFARQGSMNDLNVFNAGSPLDYKDILSNNTLFGDELTQNAFYVEDNGASPGDQTAQQIRIVEALTRLSERLSLSGKRQIEALFARYGVKPKWSQMNLARYVGGAKSTVLVDNIISNADTVNGSNGTPLGAKAGTGYCALNDLNIEVSVDEPSILMGIVSVMPHVHFVQGHSKKWQRRYLTDMFQDSLQYVGQVAVAKREVARSYVGSPSYDYTKDGETFAYCDPYYEYKMGLDILAGDFMYYHNSTSTDPSESKDLHYLQSMEQYIDFPLSRTFTMNNLLVDGDAFNKIFSYLGGSLFEDVDDHFQIMSRQDN